MYINKFIAVASSFFHSSFFLTSPFVYLTTLHTEMPKWSDLQMASGALTLVSVMMLMAYKQTKSFENETRLAFRERSRNHHQNVIENLTDSSKRREAKIEAARNKNKQIEELLKLEEMLHNLNGFPYESLLSFHKNGEGRFSIQNL